MNTNDWWPPHRPVVTSYYKSPVGTRYRLRWWLLTRDLSRGIKQHQEARYNVKMCKRTHCNISIPNHFFRHEGSNNWWSLYFLCARSFHFRSSKGSGAVFYSDPVERSYFFSGVKKIWSSASDKLHQAILQACWVWYRYCCNLETLAKYAIRILLQSLIRQQTNYRITRKFIKTKYSI